MCAAGRKKKGDRGREKGERERKREIEKERRRKNRVLHYASVYRRVHSRNYARVQLIVESTAIDSVEADKLDS
jgi:hypothetical protein